MKKYIALALFLLVMASGAFALDKAIGAGILYNYSWTSGLYETNDYDSYYGSLYYKDDWTLSRQGFGGFAFFGIGRFFELNLGLMYKIPNRWTGTYTESDNYGEYYREEYDNAADSGDSSTALQLGIYFKYPFVITDRIVLFPTVGVDYEFTLNKNGTYFDWWDDIWFRGGAGLDFFLTERIFLRGHFIYGAALPVNGEGDENFTHGLLVKLGAGWMF